MPSSAQPADIAAIMRSLALTNHAGAGPLVQACLLHALRRCDAGDSSIRPRQRAEEEEEGHRMGGKGSGGGERGGGGRAARRGGGEARFSGRMTREGGGLGWGGMQ